MLLARFKEPSTYSALAAVLMGLGVSLPSSIVQVATIVIACASAFFGFALPEKK